MWHSFLCFHFLVSDGTFSASENSQICAAQTQMVFRGRDEVGEAEETLVLCVFMYVYRLEVNLRR